LDDRRGQLSVEGVFLGQVAQPGPVLFFGDGLEGNQGPVKLGVRGRSRRDQQDDGNKGRAEKEAYFHLETSQPSLNSAKIYFKKIHFKQRTDNLAVGRSVEDYL
jgi:hypothetical protein